MFKNIPVHEIDEGKQTLDLTDADIAAIQGIAPNGSVTLPDDGRIAQRIGSRLDVGTRSYDWKEVIDAIDNLEE